ncbi:hypothetical protein [Scytonema hofmannii]|uniref:hypothetical protein n=1 Tax=Scytonema hofmannii TaxID=34078 RepID=UPI00034A786B|nr:hypothetical protein [Scytonema hofmannii]
MLVVRKPALESWDASISQEISQFMHRCLHDREAQAVPSLSHSLQPWFLGHQLHL